MALDSQQKRMAVTGVGRPYMRAVLADSVSAAQRQGIGLTYPVAALAEGDTATNRFNREFDRPFCRELTRNDTDE